MPDVALELTAVNALASLTGFSITNIRRGPDACGIDVLFKIGGRRAGAQHTTYHSDETPGKRGSLAYLGRLGQVERGKWLISCDQTREGLYYAGDGGAI